MKVIPITFRKANDFVKQHHRHHSVVQGCKFVLGIEKENALCGVAIVGRPVSRMLDDGLTAEVTRLCTDGTKNACSLLYSRARRIAFEMGYQRIITYILESETGCSLKASGFVKVGICGGGTWSRSSRTRIDKHPTVKKSLWESRVKTPAIEPSKELEGA